ncbi:cytochrome P450 [Streptomyces diastatochromogenes]|nr:cytochrome P450 [Streptomyces diastatochromogenes]
MARYRAFTEKATAAVLARRASPGRTGDLMADVAKPLPALVFARWLGIPRTDAPSFWYWNARVADLVLGTAQEESEYRASLQALVSLEDYLADLVARRRAEPADDLISQVLREGRVGDSVTEEEFVGMLTQMAFAGGETTSNLIANTVLALHARPVQLAAVREDLGLVQGTVEEALRLDGPSKMSIRTAARDLGLDGHTLRAGDRIFLVTAAANRDPARFEDPDRFDVRRTGATHLGFGFGAHFCIGAALARLVAVAAVETLVRDHPGLTVADPTGSPGSPPCSTAASPPCPSATDRRPAPRHRPLPPGAAPRRSRKAPPWPPPSPAPVHGCGHPPGTAPSNSSGWDSRCPCSATASASSPSPGSPSA